VPMVLEGGSGGAALVSSGPMSLSAGHFISGWSKQGAFPVNLDRGQEA
jgi:hypothetical protein